MSKREEATVITNDVVEDILARLPVESLLRFKSLNKSFCSLIRNPNFVYKQLHHRQHNGSIFYHALIALTTSYNIPPSYGFPPRTNEIQNMLVDSPTSNVVDWTDVAAQLSPSLLSYSQLEVVGHCNGLLCLSNLQKGAESFILWNPFLRRHRKLPVSRILSESPAHSNCLGFGHHPKSRDYLLVRLLFDNECSFCTQNVHVIKADMYSLSGDSWREVALSPAISKFMQKRNTHYVTDSVCLGRFCYWLGWNRENLDERRILVFDLYEEVFRVMTLPDQMCRLLIPRDDPDAKWSYGYHYPPKLMVWKESIAVVAYPFEEQVTKCVDVWLLDDVESQNFDFDDDDVMINVKKFFSIELDDMFRMYREVKLVWDDEIILNHIVTDETNNYYLTTIKNKNKYDLFNDDTTFENHFQIVGYINSLVSII